MLSYAGGNDKLNKKYGAKDKTMIVAGVGLLQIEQQSIDSLETAAMATRSPSSL